MLKYLPSRNALVKLLLTTAWAPIAVLIFHQMLRGTPYRDRLDFTVHSLGGASMAFVMFHALNCFRKAIGDLTPPGRYLFSFSLACVIGLLWEVLELASDVYRGTHIQQSVHETMRDLIADATGATCALALVLFARACTSLYYRLSGKRICPATLDRSSSVSSGCMKV